jgi:hypothetical protein
LLEVAVIVAVPVAFLRLTPTAAEPLLMMLSGVGLAVSVHGGRVGDGLGVGEAAGVGVGDG